MLSDRNLDDWPNAELTSVPSLRDAWNYGSTPPGLFAQIKVRFLEVAEDALTARIRR